MHEIFSPYVSKKNFAVTFQLNTMEDAGSFTGS